jgi:DNA gyrase subunit B
VKGFVEYINKTKTNLHPTVFFANGEKDGVGVEVAMQWNDSYNEQVLCFTNNIPQRDGGTHLTGLRAAMTRVINKYIDRQRNRQEGEGRDDRRRHARRPVLRAVREGAGAEVQLADQGQAGFVRSARRWKKSSRRRSPIPARNADAKIICGKIVEAARAREAPQGARDDAPQGRARRRRPARQARGLPGEGPGDVRNLHRRG